MSNFKMSDCSIFGNCKPQRWDEDGSFSGQEGSGDEPTTITIFSVSSEVELQKENMPYIYMYILAASLAVALVIFIAVLVVFFKKQAMDRKKKLSCGLSSPTPVKPKMKDANTDYKYVDEYAVHDKILV